eukprot:3839565-Rhodomonas_salina.1
MAAAVESGLAEAGFKEGASHEDWKKLSDDMSRISLGEAPCEANKGEEKREDDEDKRILEL